MKGEPHSNMVFAAALAGPLVVLLSLIALYVAETPGTFAITLSDLGGTAAILLVSLVIGFVPALAIIGIGIVLMEMLASWHPAAGDPIAWVAAGALLGGGPMLALEAGPGAAFAFGGSGAICALLSHPLRRRERGGYRLQP
jgi:hypothetical protein